MGIILVELTTTKKNIIIWGIFKKSKKLYQNCSIITNMLGRINKKLLKIKIYMVMDKSMFVKFIVIYFINHINTLYNFISMHFLNP